MTVNRFYSLDIMFFVLSHLRTVKSFLKWKTLNAHVSNYSLVTTTWMCLPQ